MSEHRVLSGETAFGNDEKAVYEALRSIPPGLILDVGAGAGYKTKTALLHSPSSRAIAFEPFPGNWSFIDKVLGEYPNVNIVKEAVSDTLRWSRLLRQGHKVDRLMKRTIQHEDTQTVLGRVQGQGRA